MHLCCTDSEVCENWMSGLLQGGSPDGLSWSQVCCHITNHRKMSTMDAKDPSRWALATSKVVTWVLLRNNYVFAFVRVIACIQQTMLVSKTWSVSENRTAMWMLQAIVLWYMVTCSCHECVCSSFTCVSGPGRHYSRPDDSGRAVLLYERARQL